MNCQDCIAESKNRIISMKAEIKRLAELIGRIQEELGRSEQAVNERELYSKGITEKQT